MLKNCKQVTQKNLEKKNPKEKNHLSYWWVQSTNYMADLLTFGEKFAFSYTQTSLFQSPAKQKFNMQG